MMKKNIFLLAAALLVAATSLFTVSCSDEFQVDENQLYGKWIFPENLAPDTVTGFNWAGATMEIKAPDTIRVDAESGYYLWTLRDNNVTATKTTNTTGEAYVIAFTVYELNASKMAITGKCRYIYNDQNTERGNISCTLTKYVPPAAK